MASCVGAFRRRTPCVQELHPATPPSPRLPPPALHRDNFTISRVVTDTYRRSDYAHPDVTYTQGASACIRCRAAHLGTLHAHARIWWPRHRAVRPSRHCAVPRPRAFHHPPRAQCESIAPPVVYAGVRSCTARAASATCPPTSPSSIRATPSQGWLSPPVANTRSCNHQSLLVLTVVLRTTTCAPLAIRSTPGSPAAGRRGGAHQGHTLPVYVCGFVGKTVRPVVWAVCCLRPTAPACTARGVFSLLWGNPVRRSLILPRTKKRSVAYVHGQPPLLQCGKQHTHAPRVHVTAGWAQSVRQCASGATTAELTVPACRAGELLHHGIRSRDFVAGISIDTPRLSCRL